MLSRFCHCYIANVSFVISGEWLRSRYHCMNCGYIPRKRHLQYILDTIRPNWTNCSIHESSPFNRYISQYSTNYTSSQYLPKISFGSLTEDRIRSENLENLSLEDSSIYIFITQDVFEHLFSPSKAASKIGRILGTGGIHIFTAPKHGGNK